ncbi:MAG: hypothetical protein GX335_00275 [Firmicutes bacterium]|nr:hypothetical protein [Bacillota bacterium]
MNWRGLKAKLKFRIQRFTYGRNGVDELTVAVLALSLVVTFLAIIFNLPRLRFFYYISLAIAVYRTLARDLLKRRRENEFLLEKTRLLSSRWRRQKQIFQERKTHRHFRCPSCGQTLRVPKGRGKIKIKCPQCGQQFDAKS